MIVITKGIVSELRLKLNSDGQPRPLRECVRDGFNARHSALLLFRSRPLAVRVRSGLLHERLEPRDDVSGGEVVGSCRDAGWFWAGRVVYLRVERLRRVRSRRGERFRGALTAVLRVRQMESRKQRLLQGYAPRLLAFFCLRIAL